MLSGVLFFLSFSFLVLTISSKNLFSKNPNWNERRSEVVMVQKSLDCEIRSIERVNWSPGTWHECLELKKIIVYRLSLSDWILMGAGAIPRSYIPRSFTHNFKAPWQLLSGSVFSSRTSCGASFYTKFDVYTGLQSFGSPIPPTILYLHPIEKQPLNARVLFEEK